MAAMGPSGSWQSGDKILAAPGRRFFWLREHVDNTIRYIELGVLFALPLVVAFFSKKYAGAIVALEGSAYYIGMLICDFDQWYNREYDSIKKEVEGFPTNLPSTELDAILERLHDFEYEYPLTLDRMYSFVLNNEIPYGMDNLDWLEMVSLLNRLSLQVGKRFEEDTKEC